VSACATCDGFFYRGKEVVVVGGGNTAVEEALFLTQFASKVTIVHRGGEFRAEKILQDRLFAHPKVEVVWNHAVEEVLGDAQPTSVTGLRLVNVRTGETHERSADGVFIAIGHAPSSDLFEGQLDMKPGGYLRVRPESTATGIEGVYAAGDVTDDVYRQAVTAAGMGCMAALDAARFLAEAPPPCPAWCSARRSGAVGVGHGHQLGVGQDEVRDPQHLGHGARWPPASPGRSGRPGSSGGAASRVRGSAAIRMSARDGLVAGIACR
jgi:hypothetical protein